MSQRHATSPFPWWPLLLAPMVASAALRDLWAPDEPRYAEVAREVFDHGSFLIMHLCGDLYPDKPPLLFWVAGLCGRLGGWTELALRLPTLASTMLIAWLVARLARRWWDEATSQWAAAAFLATVMVTEIGGRLQIDPLMTALCTLALAWLADAFDGRPGPTARALLAGMCVGLAGLAKGPVALVNVAVPAALWAVLGPPGTLPRVRIRAWFAAVGLALAPMVAWAVAATFAEPALGRELFFGQHVGRIAHGDRHPGPLWEHLLHMPLLLLPWTGIVLLGLAAGWRALLARRRPETDRGVLLAAAWFVGLVVFYSVIPVKRDLYLLPAYPAAALLAARTLAGGIRRGTLPRWSLLLAPLILGALGLGLGIAGALAATADVSTLLAGSAARDVLTGLDRMPGVAWGIAAAGTALLAAGVIAGRSGWRGQLAGWARAQAIGWAAAATVTAIAVYPSFNRVKSARPLTLEIAARSERPAAIPCVGVQPEGFRFYSRGRVPTVRAESADLAGHLAREGDNFIALLRAEEWHQLAAPLRARLRVAARHQLGGRAIVVITAAPAAAAVTTIAPGSRPPS